MAEELHKYKLTSARLKQSYLQGFSIGQEGELVCEEQEARHLFVSCALDGAKADAHWGRVHFSETFDEETVVTVYAFADNEKSCEEILYDPSLGIPEKRAFLEQLVSVKVVNKNDFLIEELEGRYLYLMVDVMGTFFGAISGFEVYNRSDVLMELFPEVYREKDSFFDRFLSMFSSEILDFQARINHVDEILDIDTTPAELLPVFAKWMGLDVSGDFLPEDRLRRLVKEAYSLNKMKGTKEALERLTEIILGERAIVLEKNVFRDQIQIEDKKIYASLYGDKPYDVTMLIKTHVPESKKSQLMFLLNQFRPIRTRLLFRFLDGSGEIDSHSYLDMNAMVYDYEAASLDERQNTDGMILLGE